MSATTLTAIILIVIGLMTVAVGTGARNGSIDLVVGDRTRDTTSADSWRRAHLRIGSWLVASGMLAVAAGIVTTVVSGVALWSATAGFAALAVMPLLGLLRGARELRAAPPLR